MTELRDVCFSYGKRRILTGLTFSAEPGECVVLAGPNGSGKSTALSVLAGVFRPDSGQVITEGRVGFVPQGTALFEDMTVRDNLRFFAGAAGCTVPEALPFGVERLGKRRVSRLSGGMKKRVSIACALLGEPRILLLDEPCAALDPEYRSELTRLIRERKAAGCTVIYVSHDPTEVMSFYDKLVFFGDRPTVYTRAELSGDPADDHSFCERFLTLFEENMRGEEA